MSSIQVNETAGWEPMPSYFQVLQELCTFYSFSVEYTEAAWTLKTTDVLYPILGAVLISTFRSAIVNNWFSASNFHHRFSHEQMLKLNYLVLNLLFLSIAWPFLFYTVYVKYQILQRPSEIWNECCYEAYEPSWDEVIIYRMFGSYTLFHTYYMTFTEKHNTWNYLLLLTHHIAYFMLLMLAQGLRHYKTGLLGMLVLKATDIPSAVLKVVNIFRIQNGQIVPGYAKLRTLSSLIVILVWVQCRFVWFPLKVIYSVGRLSLDHKIPYVHYIMSLIFVFLPLNVYWFLLLLKSTWRGTKWTTGTHGNSLELSKKTS